MAYAAVAISLVFWVALVLLRVRRRRAEDALRSLFGPGTRFVGMDIEYVNGKAGSAAFFGSMDQGCDVAQWRAGMMLAEAWFQTGICTHVEVRLAGK